MDGLISQLSNLNLETEPLEVCLAEAINMFPKQSHEYIANTLFGMVASRGYIIIRFDENGNAHGVGSSDSMTIAVLNIITDCAEKGFFVLDETWETLHDWGFPLSLRKEISNDIGNRLINNINETYVYPHQEVYQVFTSG